MFGGTTMSSRIVGEDDAYGVDARIKTLSDPSRDRVPHLLSKMFVARLKRSLSHAVLCRAACLRHGESVPEENATICEYS